MKIGDLLEKFKDRKLNKINLVYGRELLLIDNLVDAFRDLAKDSMPDFNLTIIDGQETNLESMVSAIETLSLIHI